MSTEYRDANFNPPPNPFRARNGDQYRDAPAPAEEYAAAGFYPVVREPKPEGNHRETRTLADGQWLVGWEAYDPQSERLASLQEYYYKVDVMVSMLSAFGIQLPANREDVINTIYAIVKQDVTKSADAMLLLAIISDLDKVCVTDGDIYLIATRSR